MNEQANGSQPLSLSEYKTCELVEELKKREGVDWKWADPYADLTVTVNGPALVITVID